MPSKIKAAFRAEVVMLDVCDLLPSWELSPRERSHEKYRQIAASLSVVGVIEPLVAFSAGAGKYRVLDGHKRLDILAAGKVKQVPCIVATDDESYTYNKRVNYLSPVSEHQMILRALKHNSEQTIATALNVDISTIRKKRDLLDGVCKEAVDVLKDRRVAPKAFSTLRKMKPVRQVEAAQLMVAANMYSARFALALLAGTRDEMLAEPERDRLTKPITTAQKARMEQETETFLRNLRAIETSYGTEALTLAVASRHVKRVLSDARIRDVAERRHPEILREIDALITAIESQPSESKTSHESASG